MKYTKKPVTIEAVKWRGDNLAECQSFLGKDFGGYVGDRHPGGRQEITVLTMEGPLVASCGDYLIRGIRGEHYPCKPDIFEATYAPGLPRQRPTEVFIDAEWNGYRGSLITLALVAMSGEELYVGIPLFEEADPWVREHVLPVVGEEIEGVTGPMELASRLAGFLARFEAVHLIADWPEDIERFCRALITGPGLRVDTPPLTMEIRRDLDAVASALPHNALEDARALRASYLSLMADV